MDAKDIRFIEGAARDIIENKDQQLFPMVFLVPPAGAMSIMPLPPDKREWALAIRWGVGKVHADRYMMVVESWMAKLDKSSPLAADLQSGKIRVSELPPDDREDIVMLTEQRRDGTMETAIAKVSIDRNGKRHMGNFEKTEGTMRSRFAVTWNPR